MKTINKVIALGAIMLSTLMFMPKAQGQMFQIGAYVTPSLPIGDVNTAGMEFGFGGKLFANYYFDDLEQLSVGLEAGFLSYGLPDIEVSAFGVTQSTEVDNQTFISIMVTPTWHFIEADDDFDIYAGLGAGLLMGSAAELNSAGLDTLGVSTGGFSTAFDDSYFAIAPRVGISIELDDGWRLDGNLEYLMGFTPEITETVTVSNPLGGPDITNEFTTNPIDITALTLNLGVTYFLMD